MSIRRTTLVIVSVACLLVLLSIPVAARPAGRHTPSQHPRTAVPSRPVLDHGNRVSVRPHGTLANSSQPRDLVSHGGFVWFSAYAPGHGYALWKSDTFHLIAVKDDIDPFDLTWAGNKLFFVA